MTAVQAGLDGIVVAETELSDVDGERGELIVRGYAIEDLVGHVTFEDACVLLWSGRLPSASEREQWRARLATARRDAFDRLASAGDALELPDGMDAVRAALAHLSAGVEGIDAYLCCVIDHGLNASTLAARVVASTGSDLVSAVVAGVGALKGPLHGGAPGPVLDMLDAIGAPEHTRAWLRGRLAAGERIMGMGHRVYRVRDPRAAALERAETLLEERYPNRHLRANVEFYTAVLLEAVGIPRSLFSPTFAVSRVAGWCAHYDEQRRRGRLMRPLSKYIGPIADASFLAQP